MKNCKKLLSVIVTLLLAASLLTSSAFAISGEAFIATPGEVNLRDSGSFNSNVIDAAPQGATVYVLGDAGYGWYKVSYNGKTGYMASVRNTTAPAEEWIAGGVPITMMMNMERRHGEMKPVIQKALVRLDGAPFKAFVAQRDKWAIETAYVYPGPIQYFGPTEVCDEPTKTLQLELAK